ncbi:hypothetical protein EC988_004290, partial [Linderina pennispora]
SPRPPTTNSRAARVKSWFNRRASRRIGGVHGFDQPLSIGSVLSSEKREQPEILQHMRVHRGVIDPDALSELPPDVLFSHVLSTLDELGFTVLKTEGLKIRVLRPRRQAAIAALPPLEDAPVHTRTSSTFVPGLRARNGGPAEGPRRSSVPVVSPLSDDRPEWTMANKRATIMAPGQLDRESRHNFARSEKSRRPSRTLGQALTSVRRFFGGSGIKSKRWLSSISHSTKDAADPAADSQAKTGRPRSGSTASASKGLGITVSAGGESPHRRSMSESSPYLSAAVIRDQVNGAAPNSLSVVPEDCEAPPTPIEATLSGLSHQAQIPSSPFSHTASFASGANTPFTNPFQPEPTAPYGSSQVDNGEEVQLAVEVCKIKNLNNFFIVHLSRRKGNVWAYKHLYHLIMERLALRSNDHQHFGNQQTGARSAYQKQRQSMAIAAV